MLKLLARRLNLYCSPTELLKFHFEGGRRISKGEILTYSCINSKHCSSPERSSATLDNIAVPDPAPERPTENQFSSLGLLDEEHMTTFRNALDKVLLTEISESTYSEIVDGLPTLDLWNEFYYWVPGINPMVELKHKELCTGSWEKAEKLCTEFDIYILHFSTQVYLFSHFGFQRRKGSVEGKRIRLRLFFCHQASVLPSWIQLVRDFQDAHPGKKEHILALIELLARSCHEIALLIFQLDEGVYKHVFIRDLAGYSR
jgi:hypothetical protein